MTGVVVLIILILCVLVAFRPILLSTPIFWVLSSVILWIIPFLSGFYFIGALLIHILLIMVIDLIDIFGCSVDFFGLLWISWFSQLILIFRDWISLLCLSYLRWLRSRRQFLHWLFGRFIWGGLLSLIQNSCLVAAWLIFHWFVGFTGQIFCFHSFVLPWQYFFLFLICINRLSISKRILLLYRLDLILFEQICNFFFDVLVYWSVLLVDLYFLYWFANCFLDFVGLLCSRLLVRELILWWILSKILITVRKLGSVARVIVIVGLSLLVIIISIVKALLVPMVMWLALSLLTVFLPGLSYPHEIFSFIKKLGYFHDEIFCLFWISESDIGIAKFRIEEDLLVFILLFAELLF